MRGPEIRRVSRNIPYRMSRLLEYTSHHALLAAFAVAAAVAVLVYEWRHRSHSLSALAPQDVVRLMNQGAAVIDVRGAEAYLRATSAARATSRWATSATAGETLKRFKEKPVMVCCERGPRRAAAMRAAAGPGLQQVVQPASGGMQAWRSENLPVARD